MPLACKLCIMQHGLRGTDIANLPKTEEELFEHLEQVHGIIVNRDSDGADPHIPVVPFYPAIDE